MHDSDRVQLESDLDEFEEEFEYEYEDEDDDLAGEFEFEEDEGNEEYEFEEEYEYEFEDDDESPFDEAEEMELAAELLEVQDDEELEFFLRKLGKRLKRGFKRLRKRVGKPLRRVLRRVAKRALPIAGRAVGGFFGGPAGAAIGGGLGSRVGKAFGLELEGLSPEDQEFEVARKVVRLAGTAIEKAADSKPSVSPASTVNRALMMAAKKHAPGLIKGAKHAQKAIPKSSRRSGRWVRRGTRIILQGV